MYFHDHYPPHFHAIYNDEEIEISIRDFAVMEGSVPPRILGLIMEWAALHTPDLLKAWEQLSAERTPDKIEGLK
jgi:hypothetical protein